MSRHFYIIYEERALTIGTDEAAVLESCSSLRDAKRSGWDGRRQPLGIVYEYDVDGENVLVNERYLGTVPEIARGPSR